MQDNPVRVMGLGPCPERVSPEQEEILRRAGVLAGGTQLLQPVSHYGAELMPLRRPLSEWIFDLQDRRQRGQEVVVLADGDPLFFGIGARLCRELGPEATQILPGVSVLQAAAARLCLPWQEIAAVSLHGRSDTLPLRRALAQRDRVGVYTDEEHTPGHIARELLCTGVEGFEIRVLERLFRSGEKVQSLSLEQAAEMTFAQPNLVLLERRQPPQVTLVPGLAEEELEHESGLISKREVRLASLGALGPNSGDNLWDIGAGSGSLALEASLFIHRGRILAVEKEEARLRHIQKNISRTGAYAVEPVHGIAPDCFPRLPDPDRIFLGGGAGKDHHLLEEAWSRLRPGGRLVANLVLWGSLRGMLDWAEKRMLQPELTQIQVNRGSPLQGDLRLAALNPVYILACQKR